MTEWLSWSTSPWWSIAPPYGSGEWQLFNVAQDPGENDDLADEQPELLETLRAAWDRYAEDVGVVLREE